MTSSVIENVRASLASGRKPAGTPASRPAILPARKPGSVDAEIETFLQEVRKLSGTALVIEKTSIPEALKVANLRQKSADSSGSRAVGLARIRAARRAIRGFRNTRGLPRLVMHRRFRHILALDRRQGTRPRQVALWRRATPHAGTSTDDPFPAADPVRTADTGARAGVHVATWWPRSRGFGSAMGFPRSASWAWIRKGGGGSSINARRNRRLSGANWPGGNPEAWLPA